MENLREFYHLSFKKALSGGAILTTVFKGESFKGAKALWIKGELAECYPENSKDLWQTVKIVDETSGCRWQDVDFNNQKLTMFVEPLSSERQLIVCGGGHVSLPVATIGKILGFKVTVIDDRSYFANTQRFPDCRVICQPFAIALADLGGPDCYVVIVTRGHQYDSDCLRMVLQKENAYVGMIGSRNRVALVKQTIAEEGIPQERIDKVYSPIGLNIGAETPEEIAVAIMAEIIQVKKEAGSGIANREVEEHLATKGDMGEAMVTIIRRQGSAPREAGSKMIVREDGQCFGTVGGGCVESYAKQRALLSIDNKQLSVFAADISGAEVADEGMVCGGAVDFLIEPLS